MILRLLVDTAIIAIILVADNVVRIVVFGEAGHLTNPMWVAMVFAFLAGTIIGSRIARETS